MLDRAPVLAWSHGPDGQVAWANAAYRDRFDAPAARAARPPHRRRLRPRARGGAADRARRRTAAAGSRCPAAATPSRTGTRSARAPGPSGETLGFALDADDLVAAEASLRRFVETLTETFAHLPIGLAVFDKNRRLGLFNPALTDLVKIDAVWLAGRPSLRDFLERLRETRQMPEQKDFASFRRKLGELEEGAREGTYEENWQLPSGKIFRVTGRPHPQGALAFLFEDISTSIMLERKYRSELELSQATLDRHVRGGGGVRRLGDAGLRQLRLREALGTRSDGAARRSRRRRDDRALGRALRAEPGLGPARRVRHRRRGAHQLDRRGRDPRRRAICSLLVAPLPDASALVVFRDLCGRDGPAAAGAAARDAALDDLALEQIVAAGEAAVQKLHGGDPGGAIAGGLPGARRRRAEPEGRPGPQPRELRALSEDGGVGSGPLPALAAALAPRRLTLAAPAEAAAWPPSLRRAALALGLAAAELAATAARVTLALAAPTRGAG